jgi:hypothetical protein
MLIKLNARRKKALGQRAHKSGTVRLYVCAQPMHIARSLPAGASKPKVFRGRWIESQSNRVEMQLGDAVRPSGQGARWPAADRLVIVVNSAWPRATDRELFAGRSAFLYAVREAAKGL